MPYGSLNSLNSIGNLGNGVGGGGSLKSSFSTYPTAINLRNNIDISAGFIFQVVSNVTVYQLGRLFAAGNTQDHLVNLWISTNQVTPIASGTVLNSSSVDGNNFQWVSITPTALITSNTYALVVNEFNGGDQWKDLYSSGSFINTTYISNVQSAFALALSTYPTNIGSANQVYDAPAMLFK